MRLNVAALLAISLGATAQVTCPAGFSGAQDGGNGFWYCYSLVASPGTWDQARAACAAKNAAYSSSLASIRNSVQAIGVLNNKCGGTAATISAGYWIGLYFLPGMNFQQPTGWAWINGADASFVRTSTYGTGIWYPGEPDYPECVCGNARDDAPQFIPGKIGNWDCGTTGPGYACCEALAIPSVSPTQTSSASVSSTQTPSNTQTATPSSSVTQSGTQTPSSTASNTASSTRSVTATASVTRTASHTASNSASVSATASLSATPSDTSSPSSSQTGSSSATSSLTATASSSETASSSSTVSATSSLSSSASTSETSSASDTCTATSSVSASASLSASPTANATVSSTGSVSASPLPLALLGLGAHDGADANGTAAAADAGAQSTIIIAAGAGGGGLLALLALLCCLWWLLCLVPRRKREAAARARARRPSRFQRSGKLERGKSTSTMAGTLGVLSLEEHQQQRKHALGKAAVAPGVPGLGGGRAGAPAAGNSANMMAMFSAVNPALVRAKRGSTAGAALPGGAAARKPRMTMALATYNARPRTVAARQAQALLHTHSTASADEAEAAAAADAPTAAAEGEEGTLNTSFGADATAAPEVDYSAYVDSEPPAPTAEETAGPCADDAEPSSYAEAVGCAEPPAGADEAGDVDADADEDNAEPEAEDDDYMDEDEPVEGVAARAVPARAVKGGGYLRTKQKRVAEAAAAPLPPEPKKLVIGRGALITEKVETQVVRLRRVSKIRGDKTTTDLRAQASSRVARPSVAPLGGAAFSPMTSSRHLLGGGRSSVAHGAGSDSGGDAEAGGGLTTYGFIATVARLKVKAETARAAVGGRHAAVSAAAAAGSGDAPAPDAAAVPEQAWAGTHSHGDSGTA